VSDELYVAPDVLDELARLRAENAKLTAKKSAKHSMESDDWGTPIAYVELARRVLGGIDLDPCCSAYWHHWTVKSTRYYTLEDDGLTCPWSGRVLLNPPGGYVPGTRRSKVRVAWERLVEAWRLGEVEAAVWIGYSLEQLVQLQDAPAHPLQFWTLVPATRIDFLRRGANGGPPTPVGSPAHGNYITLLHSLYAPAEGRAQAERFRDEARALGVQGGALVRPL